MTTRCKAGLESVEPPPKRLRQVDLDDTTASCITFIADQNCWCSGCSYWRSTFRGRDDLDGKADRGRGDKVQCKRPYDQDENAKGVRREMHDLIVYQKDSIWKSLALGAAEDATAAAANETEEMDTNVAPPAQEERSEESIKTTKGSTANTLRSIAGGVLHQNFCDFELDKDQKSHEGEFMKQLQDLQHPPVVEYEEDAAMAQASQMSGLSEASPASPVVQQPGTEVASPAVVLPAAAMLPPVPPLCRVTLHNEEVKSNKQTFIVKDVPASHVVIERRLVTTYKKNNDIVMEMRRNLRKLQFGATVATAPLARSFLATAVGSAPNLSQQAA